MPDSRHFICTSPATSLRRMAPCIRGSVARGATRDMLGRHCVKETGYTRLYLIADERVHVLDDVEKHLQSTMRYTLLQLHRTARKARGYKFYNCTARKARGRRTAPRSSCT